MLYRKYRPQTFDQLVGQAHIIRTLQGALAAGRPGHAYLFAGPRGTGKTTIARIFAKALNCAKRGKDGNPCNACANCTSVNEGRSLDLIEIDGASNGRVDEIRAVKDSAAVAAASGGFKVFLIDEVHMVSTSGFNALLKVLEEPPSHVVFILATTDAHKILPTVLSRVQRFDFKKLTVAEIAAKLDTIARAEKAKIEPDALMAIATSSDGALRDAEVALTKVFASGEKGERITAEHVFQMLGLVPITYHPQLLGHILANDRQASLALINKLFESGVNFEHFSRDFLDHLRTVLVSQITAQASSADMQKTIKIIDAFTSARLNLKQSPIPQLPLELAVLQVTEHV